MHWWTAPLKVVLGFLLCCLFFLGCVCVVRIQLPGLLYLLLRRRLPNSNSNSWRKLCWKLRRICWRMLLR